MITVIAFLLVVGALVLVHEFGHFILAKASGIHVKEFALGFGKRLVSVTRGETRYALNLLPLGGYCQMAGMDPQDPPDPRNFEQKPLMLRLFTIVAGPLMNYALALLLFVAVLAFWGQARTNDPIVGKVLPGYPAARVGIRPGDRIVTIGGHAISHWSQISRAESGLGGKLLSIVVSRDGRRLTFHVRPKVGPSSPSPLIGIANAVIYQRLPLATALAGGWNQAWSVVALTVHALTGAVAHGKAPPLVGVVGIADLAGQSLESGWTSYLAFAAILSVNLGLFNLLPVPPLDGSRLVLLGLEGVRRRPVSQRIEQVVFTLGFYLLIAVAVVLAFHDLTRGATGL